MHTLWEEIKYKIPAATPTRKLVFDLVNDNMERMREYDEMRETAKETNDLTFTYMPYEKENALGYCLSGMDGVINEINKIIPHLPNVTVTFLDGKTLRKVIPIRPPLKGLKNIKELNKP